MKMQTNIVLAVVSLFCSLATAESKPACFLSTSDGVGLLTCADADGNYSPLAPVKLENADFRADGSYSISAVESFDPAGGIYALKADSGEELQVTFLSQSADDSLIIPVGMRSYRMMTGKPYGGTGPSGGQHWGAGANAGKPGAPKGKGAGNYNGR